MCDPNNRTQCTVIVLPVEALVTSPDHTELARGRPSLLGVLAQSIGFMGPAFPAPALLPLIVGLSATGRGTGAATPVAVLQQGVVT
jgi:hypothetical protein